MRTSNYFKILIGCCLLLTGCSVFSPVTPVSNMTYVVNTVPAVPVHQRHGGSIFVAEPATVSIYNTTDMAYSTYRYQIGFFVKSSWAATPAQMLQPLIVQTLQNTKHFSSVNSAIGVGQSTYMLNTQLLQFQQDFTSGQNIFRLHARLLLISSATNHLIASKDISIAIPASQNTPYGGVVAANMAVRDMLAELARFCAKHT
ncbi:MAG: ABC-type transport auxiliary lipoprotein family protein [Pseudomonadota bacterium]